MLIEPLIPIDSLLTLLTSTERFVKLHFFNAPGILFSHK